MRTLALIIGFVSVLAGSAVAQAQKQQIGPIEVTGYKELTLAKNEVTVSGPRVYIHTLDGRFEAKAQKMVITFISGGAAAAAGSFKTAALTGDVWMLTKPAAGQSTEATASRVDVDWAEKRQAVLVGSVQMKSYDPTKFQGPLTVTADKATVSLKPDSQLGPGESRIRIESEDPNRSRLEFTPLPPKTSEQK